MLSLSKWSYIIEIPSSGSLEADVISLLTANSKQEVAEHCLAVAKISEEIAARFGLDVLTARNAALLHDISSIMEAPDMLDLAINRGWELHESERKYPFLLHQRVSVIFAKELLGVDSDIVLSAIECHTTLREKPSDYDMVLFIADKLSWVQNGQPPFYDAVASAAEK